MNLLLTSNGLSNETLRKEFLHSLQKSPKEVSVAFVITASTVQSDTEYVTKDKQDLYDLGIREIVEIDIARERKLWEEDLQRADVIYVEGGNTFYLLDCMRKAKFQEDFSENLQRSVYVGVSAGSIVVTPTIAIAMVEPADQNDVNMSDFTGLHLVDFEVSPHTPSYVPVENVRTYAKSSSYPIYAIDDGCAIKYRDGLASFVGEGFHELVNDVS